MNFKKKKLPPNRVAKWRFWAVVAVLLCVGAALAARMVYLTVFDRPFLLAQGNVRTLRVINIPAYRGMITDRNGQALAISTPVDAIWVNPKECHLSPSQIKTLAILLHLNPKDLNAHLQKNADHEFLYLKRQVDPAVAQRVKVLHIPGVYLKGEFRRYYPEGEVDAQLVGFTNIDDRGESGLELSYDQWLHGVPGKERVLKDRLGHVVEDIDRIRQPAPGHDLVLSIDQRIQYSAYRALKEAVARNKADSGSIVVLDSRTGEVLAMANVPSFNPNNRMDYDPATYRNRAMTDTFEPGSTLKTFMAANAIASGLYHPDSTVDTEPGYMFVNGWRVEDEHDNGVIDLTTIIQRSSNVGAAKITLSLPPASLPTLLQLSGFGQRVTDDFPGEVPGNFQAHRIWSPIALSTLSFGYGIAVTTLQLAAAYQMFANDGLKCNISLLRTNGSPKCRLIVSKSVAQQVKQVLQSVVEKGGTAPAARIANYHIAGKTGTARILGPHGYESNHHNSLFVGMAPATDPRIVIAIFIHDPRGKVYFGGDVAGPVFATVMSDALRILNVPPDDLPIPVPDTPPATTEVHHE